MLQGWTGCLLPARGRGAGPSRGFTLIELMLVVAIVGALAAIAIPNFLRMNCRAKQGEAKTFLRAIVTAEAAYQHEFDEYLNWADLKAFGGFDRRSAQSARYYDFAVIAVPPPASRYDAYAYDTLSRVNPPNVDVWTTRPEDPQPVLFLGFDACAP